MYLGIFQGKKATDVIYTCGSAGYSVVVTDTQSRQSGGVAVFHRPAPHFAVEAVQQFGPNLVGFQLATGERRWYIVECYLIPRRHLDARECRRRSQGAPQGRQAVGGGGLQCQPGGAGGRPEGIGYRGSYGNGGTGRYVGALPPVPALIVPGREDVEHDQGGEGGAVPGVINSGDRSPSLWKCLCPGSQA